MTYQKNNKWLIVVKMLGAGWLLAACGASAPAAEVPGRYLLVNHALSRLERGLAGYLIVEGADNPDVFFRPKKPMVHNRRITI